MGTEEKLRKQSLKSITLLLVAEFNVDDTGDVGKDDGEFTLLLPALSISFTACHNLLF